MTQIKLTKEYIETQVNLTEKVKLTKEYIESLPFAIKGQQLYFDTDIKGFGLLVSKGSKTYFLQRKLKGKTIRIKIGSFGPGGRTPDQARKRASKLKQQMEDGIDPRGEASAQITLQEALDAYLVARGKLRKSTKDWYKYVVKHQLSDWLEKPLADITGDKVAARHAKIADSIKAKKVNGTTTGKATADAAFRVLRAVWSHARAINPTLPENPVQRLSGTKTWFGTKPRTGVIQSSELYKWYAAVASLTNPVARDYLLLVLFTGMRREEAASLRWSDINLVNRTLLVKITKTHVPLELPLSDFVFALLKARKKDAAGSKFVFPADSASGHIEEPRSALKLAGKASGITVSVHDLRRSFITIAESCNIAVYALKALVNHSTGGDITGQYLQMNAERLRDPVKVVAAKIVSLLKPPRKFKR